MLFHSIVNTQEEGGVCKGGLWVKRSHMGISFNCARPMSTSAPRGMFILAGSCSLYELKVGPVTFPTQPSAFLCICLPEGAQVRPQMRAHMQYF